MKNNNDNDGEDWIKDLEENPENWESDTETIAKISAYYKKDAYEKKAVKLDLK